MKLNKNNVKEEQSLPVNRKQVFFRSFRSDYSVILLVSIFMTLLALPLIAVVFVALVRLTELSAADLTVRENVVAMYEVRLWMYMWCIPAMAVLAIGASGGFYVIRRLVWNEEVKFFRDFGKGIKSNVLQFEIVTLIFSLFVFGISYGADLLTLNLNLGGFYPYLIVIQVFLILLALSFLLFQYCEIVVYKSGIFKQIQNSFLLTLGSLPRTFLALIGVLLPVLLILLFMFLSSILVLTILSTALALVGFGYAVLLFTLHCHYVFDKHVNKTNFPEIYRKGLYDGEAAQEKYDRENKRDIR